MISLMDISMYTAALSAILLLGLIVTYARMFRDTHAQFSLGLMIFALILFAQNILAVYSFITMSNLVGDPLPTYLLGINIAEVLGIAVLFKTTLR
jgi:hypothetical protein